MTWHTYWAMKMKDLELSLLVYLGVLFFATAAYIVWRYWVRPR